MRPRAGALVLAGVILSACSATPPSPQPSSGVASASGASQPPTQSPSPTPSATPVPPELSARPLIWFAPLPPLPIGPGREYTGSDDFMHLFAPGAAWGVASSRVQVFKLYGEWVAYDATDAELQTAVAWIAEHGMALAVEMGPLTAPATCGQGVESFAGIDEGRKIGSRIRQAGGVLQVVALDEPYFFAHLYDGAAACHWPVDQVADAVATFVSEMRTDWPSLIVGDTEPMPATVSAGGLAQWLDAYRAAAGEQLAFLHMDVDWGRPDWPTLGLAVQQAGDSRGVPIGIIYNGGAASSDAQWAAVAGARVVTYEVGAGAHPDHVLFQSWMDKPDRVVPETDPTTFTALINRYFDDRAALAQVPGGTANLALDAKASASAWYQSSTPDKAVDGDGDSVWSAGTGPPGWIRIDLGAVVQVSQIRLTVSQYPSGATYHQVSCATSSDGKRTVVGEFNGMTHDLDVLTVTLTNPVACRFLRVDTLSSPSWVAWREIEVYAS